MHRMDYRFRNLVLIFVIMILGACGGSGSSSSDTSNTPPPPTPNPSPSAAVLSWDPVTTNIDGTPCTDLAGYRIYYGENTPVTQSNSTRVNVGLVTTIEIGGLSSGKTYYFRISSFKSSGVESQLSPEEGSKTIQ